MQPKTVRLKADKRSASASCIIHIKHYMRATNSFHATSGEQCSRPEQKREACATRSWHERQPLHISCGVEHIPYAFLSLRRSSRRSLSCAFLLFSNPRAAVRPTTVMNERKRKMVRNGARASGHPPCRVTLTRPLTALWHHPRRMFPQMRRTRQVSGKAKDRGARRMLW